MNSRYTLGNDVITVGGQDGSGLQGLLKSTIGANYAITAGIIVVLVIIIIYLMWKSREKLSTSGPTNMMRYVSQSLSGSDALEMPTAAQCAASAGDPYKGGAWGWMNELAHAPPPPVDPKSMAEGMASKKEANTDAALSAVMSGY